MLFSPDNYTLVLWLCVTLRTQHALIGMSGYSIDMRRQLKYCRLLVLSAELKDIKHSLNDTEQRNNGMRN